MIAPGNSGHRSQAIARDAARQVSARKYGIRLTWILPSTAKERGSTSALRWPWHNRKRASDIWNRRRVHRRRVFVVHPPPNHHVHARIGIESVENRLPIMAFRSNTDKLRHGGWTIATDAVSGRIAPLRA